MKKNLLDKAAAEKIITRVNSLQPTTTGKWGVMDTTEMLLHCNICNKQILEGDIEYSKSTLKQKMLKVLALYVVPNFPKNMATASRNDTHRRIDQDQFENQKKQFIATIKKFADNKDAIALTHPAFGNLNTNEWGIAAWKHTDHHLRQFGV
jgi:hypothetical protein